MIFVFRISLKVKVIELALCNKKISIFNIYLRLMRLQFVTHSACQSQI